MALARTPQELEERSRELQAALEHGAPLPAASELLHNDLQRAAVSLCPQIAEVLREAREAGADAALVSGSGPTVIGLFAGGRGSLVDGPALAEQAARALSERVPGAMSATPVGAAFARAATVGETGPATA
jgi:4-diphosphocytidyl-2-C-methyl-D-erythritol kinase